MCSSVRWAIRHRCMPCVTNRSARARSAAQRRPAASDDALVDLQFDPDVGAARKSAGAGAKSARRLCRHRGNCGAPGAPARSPRALPSSARTARPPRAGRVVEQTDVGASHLAVQLRREAVRRNVDHAPAARHRLPDETLDLRAIGPVMLLDDLRAERRRRAARRRREELRMTDRAIEVDEQTADGRGSRAAPRRPWPAPSP